MMSLHSKCTINALDPECHGRCIYRCSSCGLHHRYVECRGIYYCPNPLCRNAGADWFRSGIPSYKSDNKGRSTVDMRELVEHGIRYALADRDPDVRSVALACARRLIDEHHLDSPELVALVNQIPTAAS